jgi:hypothetical protein
MLVGGFWEYIILKLPKGNGQFSHKKPNTLNSVWSNTRDLMILPYFLKSLPICLATLFPFEAVHTFREMKPYIFLGIISDNYKFLKAPSFFVLKNGGNFH